MTERQRRGREGRGVVRIDIDKPKHTHGWQARVYQGRQAQTRFFSDSKHGGRGGAFEAAAEARTQMEMGLAGTASAVPSGSA